MGSNNEKVFLSTPDITVTNARFVVPGQTYAMSGVTSVSKSFIKPSRKGAVFCIAVGVGALLLGLSSGGHSAGILIGGLLWSAVGVAWWAAVKTTYVIRLNTAGGQTEAYSSKDKDLVDKVVDALNEAIIARG